MPAAEALRQFLIDEGEKFLPPMPQNAYQPPLSLPISAAMSVTSTNLSSNRKAQLKLIAVMSGPEAFSAAVVTRVSRLPTLTTS